MSKKDKTFANDKYRGLSLHESLARLTSFFEKSTLACIITGPDYTLQSCNESASSLLGYHDKDLAGKTILDLLADKKKLPEKTARRLKKGDQPFSSELLLKKTDGSSIWVDMSVNPFKGSEGQVIKNIIFLIDITERKEIDLTLAKSSAKLRSLYEGSLDGYVRCSIEGRLIEFNQAYLDMTGYSEEELHELNFQDFTPPEWYDKETEILSEALEKGYSPLYRKEYIKKDGTVFPVELRIYLHSDNEGNPDGYWAFIRDISEQKRKEDELEQIEWLLSKREEREAHKLMVCTSTRANESRLILDSIGEKALADGISTFLDLLESSACVHEKNGDCAAGFFSSGWCQYLNKASQNICLSHKKDEKACCNEWGCHDSCWNDCAKVVIKTGQTVDIECFGGLRRFGAPIFAGGEVAGAISLSYGDPPKDPEKIEDIAEKCGVDPGELETIADDYDSRPPYIIDLAKDRLLAQAAVFGQTIERKLAEEKTAWGKSKLESIIAGIKAGLVLLDADARIIWINDIMQEWFGSLEDLIGKPCYKLLGLKKPESQCASFMARKSGKVEVRNVSTTIISGEERNFKLTAAPITNAQGEIMQFVELVEDVTDITRKELELDKYKKHLEDLVEERTYSLKQAFSQLEEEFKDRREAEKALAEREKWNKAIVSAIPDALFIIDRSGTYIDYMPDRTITPLYKPEEVLGKKVAEVVPADVAEKITGSIEKVLETGETQTIDIDIPTKGGVRSLDARLSLMGDDKILCVNRNISKRKKAESEQVRLRERLESLWSLAQMIDADHQTLCDHTLQQTIALTESRLAFYGVLNEDESEITALSWSRGIFDEDSLSDKSQRLSIDEAGIWAEAVRQRNTVICNDCKGEYYSRKSARKGPVTINRMLSIPVFSKGRIIAIAAVADKGSDYTEEEARQLTTFVTNADMILRKKEAETEVMRNYDIQAAISSILKLSLENIDLEELLDRSIQYLFSVPWLAVESKGAVFLYDEAENDLRMVSHPSLAEPIQKACAKIPLGKCLCGLAAEKRELIFADHIGEEHVVTYDGISPHGHYCVPMLSGGKLLGVFTLYLQQGHPRDPLEESFLTSIANALAGVIERRRAEEALMSSERYTRSLLRIARLMEQARNHIDILKAACTEVKEVMGYNTTWLALSDPEREYVDIISIEGGLSAIEQSLKGDKKLHEEVNHLTVKGDPLLEEVVLDLKPVVVEEACDDPHFNKKVVETLGNRSMVSVPVELTDGSVAVLNTGTFGDEGTNIPDGDQLDYFTSMASQVAVVLDRFRVLKEREESRKALELSERYTRSLLDVAKSMEKARSLEDIVRGAHKEILKLIGYHSAWLGVSDKKRKELEILNISGEVPEANYNIVTIPVAGDRMMQEIVQCDHPVVVEDARTDPRTDKKMVATMGNRTIINIPKLLMDGSMCALGTGTFVDEGVHPPTEQETAYLSSMASSIAVVLDRFRFLEEREAAQKKIEVSEQHTRSLLRQTKAMEQARDYDDIVRATHAEIMDMLGYNSTYIAFADEENEKFTVLSTQGTVGDVMEEEQEFKIKGDPWLEEIVSCHGPMVAEEAIEDPRTNKEIIKAIGQRTLIAVPVRLMDGSLIVMGTGTFGDEGVKVPTEEQLDFLSSMASNIAVVLDRFRFLEEREQARQKLEHNLETQIIIGSILKQSLEEITTGEVLDKALEQLISLDWLKVESKGAILLIDKDGDNLDMVAQSGMSDAIQTSCSHVPVGTCLCGRAAESGKLVFSEGLDERHNIVYEGMTPHGHYCVPMRSAGKTIGVIVLYTEEGHPYSDEEERFLTSVANALAGVVSRRRTEEALAASERYTKSLLRFAKKAEQARSPEDLIKAAYPEVDEILGYKSTWMGFIDEEQEAALMMAMMGNVDNFVEFETEYKIKGDAWLEEMAAAEGPIFMEDAMTDPRADPKVIERDGYRTMLCVPIRLMDESLVVLCTGTFRDEGVKVPSQDQIEYFSSMASDIAVVLDRFRFLREREEAQAGLAKSEEKYRTLFESSQDVVFIMTPDGHFKDINPAGVELFGFNYREELLEKDSAGEGLISAEDMERILEIIRKQAYVKNLEFSIVSGASKEYKIFLSANAVYDKDGNITEIRGTMRDVTEYRKLEEQLVQSQKMESIGRLAGGISHDFNNYLTAIEGYTDLVLREVPEDSQIFLDLTEARKSAERAGNLTRQLLLFSRREVINRRKIDLNEVVSNLLGMLNRLIGEKYTITTDFQEDAWHVSADSSHMEQVLMNLVVNAKDAMTEGGNIHISTANAKIGKDFISVHPEVKAGKYVCLSVADNGYGMDAETVSHIFEPFYSTKKSGEGTGLGLSVVHGIISQHNGWVDVESVPGEGSIFRIYLPAILDISTKEKAVDIKEEKLGQGEKILLVEDESSVRSIAERMLLLSGYTVYSAADAVEALQIFNEHMDEIKMVFSDIVLPGEDGVSLSEQFLLLKPDLKVLLSSGYSNEMDWDRIHQKGFRFIKKPYVLSELQDTIREVLEE